MDQKNNGAIFWVLAIILVCLIIGSSARARPRDPSEEETLVKAHLEGEYETDASNMCTRLVDAEWEYNIDLANENKEEKMNKRARESADFQEAEWNLWFKDANYSDYEDQSVARQVMFLSVLGVSALDNDTFDQYNSVLTNMTGIYGQARICPYDNQNCDLATEGLRLEPDMEAVMAISRDYDELEYVWDAWRDASGAKIRSQYEEYVALSNLAAEANGFDDMGAMWRQDYETEDFETEVQRLWEEVKPLYDRLYKYVLKKLKEAYGDKMPSGDVIPAHILGNMWAQDWQNIYDMIVPYPSATPVDITQNMIDQHYDAMRMFEEANKFYMSMGLMNMSMAYTGKAVIEQLQETEMVCHASAWDFCDGVDFRVKMCTNVDEEDFITVHHELGHIQYFLQYKDQPITFRKGANPGFHEAVGDVISLSVANPLHYEKVGLLFHYEENDENTINTQLRSALSKVAFLPFAMVIDTWRWEVFSGTTIMENWNKRWWELRKEYQMLVPPNERTEQDFDPGAKYHVAGNSQYINYFVAHILQFQMYRALCIEAGEYDPENPSVKALHTCDLYRSTKAGAKMRDMLLLGGSKHWSEVLKALTGDESMTGAALLEYYAPLYDWLDKETTEVSQTVPIVVGSVLGAVAVAALTAYFVKEYRNKKKNPPAELPPAGEVVQQDD